MSATKPGHMRLRRMVSDAAKEARGMRDCLDHSTLEGRVFARLQQWRIQGWKDAEREALKLEQGLGAAATVRMLRSELRRMIRAAR